MVTAWHLAKAASSVGSCAPVGISAPPTSTGNHGRPSRQRRRDLAAYEVFPGRLARGEARQPLRTDDREEVIASCEGSLDGLLEVLARLNIGYVHEDTFRAETCDQAIGEPAGVTACVIAAVADENTGHRLQEGE